ncbi:MAG TPA: M56 family metallopeptidase [Rhizomicrobium sp.]|nr:M56 family metallopeptidase [Rhizomicrobium sp.]
MSLLLLGAECLAAATLIPWMTNALAARAKQAGSRHLVRLSGLAVLLLLPLFAALVPSEFVLHAAEPAAVSTAVSPPASTPILGLLLTGLAVLWFAGVFALLARGLVGGLALRALFRHGECHSFDAARLSSWAGRAGFKGDWRFRLSAEIETPISWGIVRPTILLPQHCAAWPAPEQDAAMLHELAHLRRRDGLAQTLALFCCAFYWPHPLVWAEARALRADAEEAADDAVILSGVRQSDYADLLLRVAGGGSQPPAFAGLEFSMAGHGGLETRIRSILASNPSRSGVTKMQILKTSLFGTAAALVLALARPSFGADQQAAPLPPAQPPASVLPAPEAPPTPAPVVRSHRSPGAARHTERNRVDTRPDPDVHISESVARAIGDAHIDETIAQAMAGAHIEEKVAAAMADAHISEKVSAALAEAHISEKVSAALAEAHIDQKIAAALKAAQPEIDAAMARLQAEHAPPPPPQ